MKRTCEHCEQEMPSTGAERWIENEVEQSQQLFDPEGLKKHIYTKERLYVDAIIDYLDRFGPEVRE